MANDRPDPGEFLDLAQRMLRQFLGEPRGEEEPWAQATRRPGERTGIDRGADAAARRDAVLALGTRAVEALEDLALDVAAIRQRLERWEARVPGAPPADGGLTAGAPAPEGPGAGGPGAGGPGAGGPGPGGPPRPAADPGSG